MLKQGKLWTNIILLLSAYIPLYLTIIVQNSFSLWNKLNNTNEIFIYPETWITLIFMTFIAILFCLLTLMFKNTYNTNNSLSYEVKIIRIDDKNHEYLTSYIAVYILPFITLNLTTYSGLAQFTVLFLFIGYIYLKYEMIYINPILNIFFNLNIYDVNYVLKDNDKTYDSILLSKKGKDKLRKGHISVKGSNGILIDLNKD